jgi:ubiquinone/menaquinone biosynthesis C-methylase UbiE
MPTVREIQDRVQSHYDAFPFDNFTDGILGRLAASLLGRTLRDHSAERAVQLDIGCGTGKSYALLERTGRGALIGIDLSVSSLRQVRRRQSGAPLVNASNLALPIRDETAALALSEGVLHHTPDARASFGECARVLAPRGHLYVSVYDARNRYRTVYEGVGRLFRALGSTPFGEFVLRSAVIPIWYVYYCYLRSLVTRGSISRLSLERSANLFYDRYMVPQASFHTPEQLSQWGHECGLETIESAVRGSMIEVLFLRPPAL